MQNDKFVFFFFLSFTISCNTYDLLLIFCLVFVIVFSFRLQNITDNDLRRVQTFCFEEKVRNIDFFR